MLTDCAEDNVPNNANTNGLFAKTRLYNVEQSSK